MSRPTQGTTKNKSYLCVQDYHLLQLSFPELFHFVDHLILWPYNPNIAETTLVWANPRSFATTRGIINYFLFLWLLRCFSSPGQLSASGVISLQDIRLSHSEISGSHRMCQSPELIAAYHVFHRLQKPRHPPYALTYFLKFLKTLCIYYVTLNMSKNFIRNERIVENIGVEPMTSCVQGRRSSQLS